MQSELYLKNLRDVFCDDDRFAQSRAGAVYDLSREICMAPPRTSDATLARLIREFQTAWAREEQRFGDENAFTALWDCQAAITKHPAANLEDLRTQLLIDAAWHGKLNEYDSRVELALDAVEHITRLLSRH